MTERELAALFRPELQELTAYAPETGSYPVRLDANEAPPLLGAAGRARLAAAAAETAWERYPDAAATALRQAVAQKMGVDPAEVVLGVGSDELISLLLTVLSEPRDRGVPTSVLTSSPTFVMYRLSARVRGLRVVEVPLDADWQLSLPALEQALSITPPNLVFVASPNNPTGNAMRRADLERLVELARGALVVIDEAYVDYADADSLDLYRTHENVVILRTLSKIGYAALRVGWLIGRPWLAHELEKARLPYNLCTLSQRLATLALTELAADTAEVVRAVKAERERLAQALAEQPGIRVTPSDANFLWLRCERPAADVFHGLAERGVLVRSFHARGGRLAQQIRVTIGTPAENDRFLSALREVL